MTKRATVAFWTASPLLAALALSAAFTGFAIRVLRDSTHRSAKQMFGFSILYLFLLFALMLIDRAPQGVPGLA